MSTCVLIVPADLRDRANELGAAMGWGSNNYTIPLTSNGTTITHWATNVADPAPEFLDMLQEGPPSELGDFSDVMGALIPVVASDFATALTLANMTLFDGSTS